MNDSPMKEREINKILSSLNATIEETQTRVECLRDRLSPVSMSKPMCQPSEKETDDCLPSLALEILNADSRVRLILKNINSMIEDLEI